MWPCPTLDHPGTPILYEDGSFVPKDSGPGKARLVPPHWRKAGRPSDGAFPLLLVPGRVLLQSDREMEISKDRNNGIVRDEQAELNPQDAAALGIEERDTVEVVTAGGRFPMRASIKEAVPSGVVASTSLFGQLAVDLQASDDPDPMTAVPHLNIIPARVEKAARS